ncbi:uncharacterized protein [Physcomitrium patens]|uniref:Uncharacterized protein n=1 Tax=Physcomitrium patens TaxID=3218 RepID=A9T299_PHYPA|nr:uncharacterized protein LOC112282725 [Physcomitrium patens]XP_024376494.1 uncharacterized protein LOC112282725 [Physcomitrium patens]XP_024376495.1 uncharacterized protein LOC112282725 [Physcomitrium patens]XP_024376496.1 uncharacterized protein LOC112282725 [Physcomitrium patens]PNR54528.1 hypothetical protein PHYPA_008205 [Physcomitrium patens]|eukprot:XP_024376493.1 uncharacterized protein LOC112282725 [Physcomitrella patens]
MQPNNGEPMAIFSPGVLDSSGYGSLLGCFSAAPIDLPEVELKRGKRNSRKVWKDAIPMGIEESNDVEFSPDGRLNWTEPEVWKEHESMKILESSKDKSRKEKRKEKHDYSSDEERKDGRKRRRRDIETAVPWTEEMVKYLFETYDDVHRRLYIESRGKVKNQKKWDPIIKTMQEKFGRIFTKNQCESKYWKVRRECAKYKLRLEKRAQHEKDAYPSKAVRELLKPKLYDVWLEFAGGKSVRMPENEVSSGSEDETAPEFAISTPANDDDQVGDGNEEDGEASHHRHSASCAIVREMQQLITRRVEASEKREEALNIRAELTMELLRQHMERMERTGHTGDDARQRQLQMIEGVDNKLDRLVNGLGALNTNIGAIIGSLTPTQR